MLAAGVNAKTLCSYMGHSSIKVTFDLYGHLMPDTRRRRRRVCSTHSSPSSQSRPQRGREQPAAEGARAAAVL